MDEIEKMNIERISPLVYREEIPEEITKEIPKPKEPEKIEPPKFPPLPQASDYFPDKPKKENNYIKWILIIGSIALFLFFTAFLMKDFAPQINNYIPENPITVNNPVDVHNNYTILNNHTINIDLGDELIDLIMEEIERRSNQTN